MARTPSHPTLPPSDLASLVSTLQTELAGVKAELTAKVQALEGTIANLAHENTLLKRRLYGTKTERSHTSEAQLALGDLLAAEQQLQRELAQHVDDAQATPAAPCVLLPCRAAGWGARPGPRTGWSVALLHLLVRAELVHAGRRVDGVKRQRCTRPRDRDAQVLGIERAAVG